MISKKENVCRNIRVHSDIQNIRPGIKSADFQKREESIVHVLEIASENHPLT